MIHFTPPGSAPRPTTALRQGRAASPIVASMSLGYATDQPERAEVDRLPGVTVLQFGTDWCGYCVAAERYVMRVLADVDDVRHLMIEDAKGRPLGRSFRIKLWPTLVFLRDGVEVARVVRPMSSATVAAALAAARTPA